MGLDRDGLLLKNHGNVMTATFHICCAFSHVGSDQPTLFYTVGFLLTGVRVLQQTIAEAHQYVTTNLINQMIGHFRGAEAHQDTDNAESTVMNMEPAAYGQAPAVHTALQGNVTDLGLQTRKRKHAELPLCPSKWARRSDNHDRMVLDSDCEVDMEVNYS